MLFYFLCTIIIIIVMYNQRKFCLVILHGFRRFLFANYETKASQSTGQISNQSAGTLDSRAPYLHMSIQATFITKQNPRANPKP